MEGFTFPSGVEVANRLMLAPMTTSSGTESGGLSTEDVAFILHRSKGFGAVILGSHSVAPTGSAFSAGWNIYDSCNHAALTQLVEQLHQQKVKVFIQLYHAGRLAQPAFIKGQQPLAPSRIPALRSFASYPKEMTTLEIKDTIQAFKKATELAIRLGFDGVELHGANTYLIQQFYSPHSNRRKDEWGGTRERRLRFPLAVIRACQEAINECATRPFLIGYRFSPEEYEVPGIRLEDTCFLLEQITKEGLDYVHVSLNDFRKQAQTGERILPTIKEHVGDTPLIGCGNIRTHRDVDAVLQQVPLCSIGNAAVIDPDWAWKILRGDHSIKSNLHVSEREQVKIPKPLWQTFLHNPLRYFLEEETDE